MNKTILVIFIILILAIGSYSFFNKKEDANPMARENSQQIVNNDTVVSKESSTEDFKNQPGEVKSITLKADDEWQLSVDLLTHNSKWIPGDDSTGEFFVNQNPKLRNLTVTSATKTYQCGHDSDGNLIGASFLINTKDYIQLLQSDTYMNRYFDINGSNVIAIYDQCLP